MEKVAVILVNYNGEKYCRKCIDSIKYQTYPYIEIIFVDNASADGSVSIIEKEFPDIKLIKLKENLGFTGGNNIGIREAVQMGASYLMLLNVDTELMDCTLIARMVHEANENTAVAPAIYSDRQRRAAWYTGGRMDRNNAKFYNTGYYDDIMHVIYVTYMVGCCMLLHKKIIARIGLFDESYFLYCEDGELSVRMNKLGIKMKYIPDVWVWHKVQFRKGNYDSVYYFNRNYYYLLDKYKGYFGVTVKDQICSDIRTIFNNMCNANFNRNKYLIMAILDFLLKRKGKRKTGLWRKKNL